MLRLKRGGGTRGGNYDKRGEEADADTKHIE